MRQVLRAGWCLSAVCVLASTLVVLRGSLLTSDRAVQRAIARCLPLTVLNFCFHATAVTSEGALLATRDLRFLCTWYAGLGVAVLAAHRFILARLGLPAIWLTYFGVQFSRAVVFPDPGGHGRAAGVDAAAVGRSRSRSVSWLRRSYIGLPASWPCGVTTISSGAASASSVAWGTFPRKGCARGRTDAGSTRWRLLFLQGSIPQYSATSMYKVMRSVIVPIHYHDKGEWSLENVPGRAILLGHVRRTHQRRDEYEHDLKLAHVREAIVDIFDIRARRWTRCASRSFSSAASAVRRPANSVVASSLLLAGLTR